jgi:hypothetical protein
MDPSTLSYRCSSLGQAEQTALAAAFSLLLRFTRSSVGRFFAAFAAIDLVGYLPGASRRGAR